MPISAECPQCHKRLLVPDTFKGSHGKCPGCGTQVPIAAGLKPPVQKDTTPQAAAPQGLPPKGAPLKAAAPKAAVPKAEAVPVAAVPVVAAPAFVNTGPQVTISASKSATTTKLRPKKNRRPLMYVAGGVAVVLIGGLAFYFLRTPAKPEIAQAATPTPPQPAAVADEVKTEVAPEVKETTPPVEVKPKETKVEPPPQEILPVTFPPPPRLATTPAEWEENQKQSDFAARSDAAIKAAEPLLKNQPALPTGPGSWIFYYACPDDGTDLKPISLAEHQCPRCQKTYTDERTVAAYRCLQHYDLEKNTEKLAWAYKYSGDERYAEAVHRVLMHLADQYATYPERVDRWGHTGILAPLGARRYVQSLDEAVGAVRLAKAYDLTRNSAIWTDAQRTHVENDFFRETAKTLLVYNQGINNHQTWYNAGLIAIASVLADAELASRVVTMPGGYRFQLQNSLGDDGVWYEGSMAYQNYALQAMAEIVDAGRRMGLPLHEEPRLKRLLTNSLEVTYPNGTYPAINDSDPGNFQSFLWSYDWAWRLYHDPRFAQAASWNNPKKLATLLGPDAKPEWPLDTKTNNRSDTGLAILRAGEGAQQTCVFFDYGQHGEDHGHYDKLNITLFAVGREWLLDTGRISYSHKEYKTWVKHTVAHNTVVIDEKDQAATTGKLSWLKAEPQWSACAGECDTAYPGVMLRRYLWLSPKVLVDVYDVTADREVKIDWLAHAVTSPVASAEEIPATGPAEIGHGEGYQHLKNGQRWEPEVISSWDFPVGKTKLRLWCVGDAPEEHLTAVGIGQNTSQPAPTLIRRRPADRSARFVTVYDLTGTGQHVTKVQLLSEENPAVAIESADAKIELRFGPTGVEVR